MNLQKYTEKLCEEYSIKPARSKGQNFLIREEVYDHIIEAANISKEDIILEVGPGLGFLTERLARKAKKVIAIELDDKLARALRDRLDEFGVKNVEVINMNVLDLDTKKLGSGNLISNSNPTPTLPSERGGRYKVVANLPYNITSVFLRKFLGGTQKELSSGYPELSSMTLMLQKEVALRIAAKPPKMSLLAISVQMYAKPEIIEQVNRDCFWPEPEVDSAIIRLSSYSNSHPPLSYLGEGAGGRGKAFFRLVKAGFSHKRKMLKNNLAVGYHISNDEAVFRIKKAGFNEKVRAQELSVEDWMKLQQKFLRRQEST